VSLSGYAHFVYGFPKNACTWWGLGTVGGSPTSAWINGSIALRVVAHEMGHNFGLYHAQTLDCGTSPIGSSCTANTYGDLFDIMGTSTGHFAAFQKERIAWLAASDLPPVTTVTTGGTYWLDPFEPLGGTSKALKILKSTDSSGARTWYYVEMRRAIGNDSFLSGYPGILNGVLIHTGSESTGDSAYLLDMTPETDSFTDAALPVGRTFTDTSANVSITPVAVSNTGGYVSVAFGAVPCVPAAPAVTASPGTTTWTSAGTAASWTVTVTNRDSSTCGAAVFPVSVVPPAGWSYTLGASSLTLAPGASASSTMAVTAPIGTPDGLASIAARAVHPSNASLVGSASVAEMVLASLTVSVSTDKASYSRNQSVQFSARVTGAGSAVAGAATSFTVRTPSGGSQRLSATTDSSGLARATLRIGRKDPVGTWQVTASAAVGSITGTGSTTFVVQ
jgi:hypothetical protein